MYFEGEKWLILSILSTKKHNLKNILIFIIVETCLLCPIERRSKKGL